MVKLWKIDCQDLDRGHSCDYRAHGSDPPCTSCLLIFEDAFPVGYDQSLAFMKIKNHENSVLALFFEDSCNSQTSIVSLVANNDKLFLLKYSEINVGVSDVCCNYHPHYYCFVVHIHTVIESCIVIYLQVCTSSYMLVLHTYLHVGTCNWGGPFSKRLLSMVISEGKNQNLHGRSQRSLCTKFVYEIDCLLRLTVTDLVCWVA